MRVDGGLVGAGRELNACSHSCLERCSRASIRSSPVAGCRCRAAGRRQQPLRRGADGGLERVPACVRRDVDAAEHTALPGVVARVQLADQDLQRQRPRPPFVDEVVEKALVTFGHRPPATGSRSSACTSLPTRVAHVRPEAAAGAPLGSHLRGCGWCAGAGSAQSLGGDTSSHRMVTSQAVCAERRERQPPPSATMASVVTHRFRDK